MWCRETESMKFSSYLVIFLVIVSNFFNTFFHSTAFLHLKDEYHANGSLRAYVYVLCLSPSELYISDHI